MADFPVHALPCDLAQRLHALNATALFFAYIRRLPALKQLECVKRLEDFSADQSERRRAIANQLAAIRQEAQCPACLLRARQSPWIVALLAAVTLLQALGILVMHTLAK